MNLIRVLIIGLLAWLVYRMIRKAFSKPRAQGPREPQRLSTKMVRCEQCGIHVPQDEAVPGDGRYFCSAEHRDQYTAQGQ